MQKDAFPVKRTVYIGTWCDDKYISKALKKESFRKLESVNFDGKKFELGFSKEFEYKPKKQFIEISKKKHSFSTKKDIKQFLTKNPATATWTILEAIEFPDRWLVFLVK